MLSEEIYKISIAFTCHFTIYKSLPWIVTVLPSGLCMLSHFSCVQRFVTLWTVACQAPLSTGFFRQKYWCGCHALLQGIFLTQGLNPGLLHLPALVGRFFTTGATWKALSWKSPRQTLCSATWGHEAPQQKAPAIWLTAPPSGSPRMQPAGHCTSSYVLTSPPYFSFPS